MKTTHYIIGFCLALALSACELIGSIDEIDPEYKLTDENVITDAKSAEAGLNGVYLSWRTYRIGWMRHLLDARTGAENEVFISGIDGFADNEVTDDNAGIETNYTALYYVVQNASALLENLDKAPSIPTLTKERRAEIVGEAKFSRALARLILLRQYGEFYNRSSAFGIVIYPNNLSVKGNVSMPRSTVEESYRAILADLDEAIAKAPATNEHYRVSQLAAKGLKARVLLYMKEFAKAAALAREVLSQAPAAGYSLEADFKQLFENSFLSKEMLFAIYATAPNETYNDGLWNTSIAGPVSSKIAAAVAPNDSAQDKRFEAIYKDLDPTMPDIVNNKYHFVDGAAGTKQDSHYYLRLAEMYYIIAEAEARLGHMAAARQALKDIICIPRAGYTTAYVDAIPDGSMLEMILRHKWMEFVTENNEEWFDLVRYHAWDKYPIAPYYVRSDRHLTLPIPRKALGGNRELKQNPGY